MGTEGWGALMAVRSLGAIMTDISNESCVRRGLWNYFHPILTLWGARWQLMFTVPNWTSELKAGMLLSEVWAFLSTSNRLCCSSHAVGCSGQQGWTHIPHPWAPCLPLFISSLDAQWQSPYKHTKKCIGKTQHQTLRYLLEFPSS